MSELFRYRLSSHHFRVALSCALLLCASSLSFSADTESGHHKASNAADRLAAGARVALFERNDPQRAEVLARREAARLPNDVDIWFVLMESASVVKDRAAELQGAIAVCKLARSGDPRANVAAMRLAGFEENSLYFRSERAAIESLANGGRTCAAAALEALYQASLDGLPNADARHLAQYSGWLTRYSISRAGNTRAAAEQFEFADARIVIPDYLPRSSSYIATTSFVAPDSSVYELSGELAGAQVSIDELPAAPGMVSLTAGTHQVRVRFSAAEASPRVRITGAPQNANWNAATYHLAGREIAYLRAATLLAAGEWNAAAQQVRSSELAASRIGQNLIAEAARLSAQTSDASRSASQRGCANESGPSLRSCAPDSLAYARWLATENRHTEAITELRNLLLEWPLDRESHRMLISELQRVGDSRAADHAAAAFLEIAPNARNFRRMAQTAENAGDSQSEPFYQPYRRPAPSAIRAEPKDKDDAAVILLQDKIAIARLDGSVSLYMHRVVQLLNREGVADFHSLAVPAGSQILSARVLNREAALTAVLLPGDEIEEEYVVNFTGDGGMIAHPEAFQCVFNDFDFPLLDARFVVLSAAAESPGYVITSGNVPESRFDYRDGIRAQIWEKQLSSADASASTPGIVRVVENENGWSIPPAVERRRILETIHPGPRPREA